MGFMDFIRFGTIGQYVELKLAEKDAKSKGEEWNETEWLKSKKNWSR